MKYNYNPYIVMVPVNTIIRRQEIRTHKAIITIEFTAQPFLPIKELSLLYNI